MIPTSNHNLWCNRNFSGSLYIFWFLHQTTTLQCYSVAACKLYIFWFLHQTTTTCQWNRPERCCISFDSYIKPQLILRPSMLDTVVYLLIPTSNHNQRLKLSGSMALYIFWFLHQTTTAFLLLWKCGKLYIFWFLHQTTTKSTFRRHTLRCISFDSYIKPQLLLVVCINPKVVYLLIPPSNHNGFLWMS